MSWTEQKKSDRGKNLFVWMYQRFEYLGSQTNFEIELESQQIGMIKGTRYTKDRMTRRRC